MSVNEQNLVDLCQEPRPRCDDWICKKCCRLNSIPFGPTCKICKTDYAVSGSHILEEPQNIKGNIVGDWACSNCK